MTDKEKQARSRLTNIAQEKNANWLGLSNIKAIKTVLNLVETQAKELEKKDKMIELMAKWIHNKGTDETEICDYEKCIKYTTRKKPLGDCIMCIKEYFERKVEEDGNKNTEIGLEQEAD